MALQINDTAPDFEAETTEGKIRFHDWIGNNWAVLFSHPKDFTPVCTTELGTMARLKPEFDKRGVKIIGLSVDPVDNHKKWSADIKDVVGFAPNYPMIGDTDLKISKLYNMLPASTTGTSEGRTPADNETVRNVFVIGPDKKIKLVLVYPMTTGRNFDEVLRVRCSRPCSTGSSGSRRSTRLPLPTGGRAVGSSCTRWGRWSGVSHPGIAAVLFGTTPCSMPLETTFDAVYVGLGGLALAAVLLSWVSPAPPSTSRSRGAGTGTVRSRRLASPPRRSWGYARARTMCSRPSFPRGPREDAGAGFGPLIAASLVVLGFLLLAATAPTFALLILVVGTVGAVIAVALVLSMGSLPDGLGTSPGVPPARGPLRCEARERIRRGGPHNVSARAGGPAGTGTAAGSSSRAPRSRVDDEAPHDQDERDQQERPQLIQDGKEVERPASPRAPENEGGERQVDGQREVLVGDQGQLVTESAYPRQDQVRQWRENGNLTFAQIGVLLGVSRARAHQLYRRAISRGAK